MYLLAEIVNLHAWTIEYHAELHAASSKFVKPHKFEAVRLCSKRSYENFPSTLGAKSKLACKQALIGVRYERRSREKPAGERSEPAGGHELAGSFLAASSLVPHIYDSLLAG